MTQTFSPTTGRTERKFAELWQVVRYETGYSAELLGLDGASYADQFYSLGRRDAVESKEQVAV